MTLSPSSTTSSSKETQSQVYFRSFDPIENLSLRIKLDLLPDHQTSLSKVTELALDDKTAPVGGGDDITGNNTRTTGSKENVSSNRRVGAESKELVVNWQQKVFSPSEIVHYSSTTEWESHIEREYHDTVMSFSNKKRAKAAKAVQATSTKPEFHLFTNIDVDNYKDLVGGNKGGGGGGGSDVQRGQGSVESMTTSRFEEDHVLAQRIENNQVPIPYLETAVDGRKPLVTNNKVHVEQPAFEHSFVEMNIMVYFSPRSHLPNNSRDSQSSTRGSNTLTDASVHRLCRIRWYDTGLIAFLPGPCEVGKAHRFQHDTFSYEYTISNASEQLSALDEKREWEIYQEFFKRQKSVLFKKLGFTASHLHNHHHHLTPHHRNIFHRLPDAFPMKVQVYGELKLAMNFDCHHNARMYVQIMWDISDKDWKIGGSGSSAGVDHLHNDKENNHHKSSSNVFLNNGNSSNNNKNKKKSGGGLSNESNDDRYIQSLLISSQCGLPVYNSTRQSYDIHYSFPFEMGLFKRLNVGKADESSALYEENNEERESSGKTSVEAGWKWPRIYFEVYSVDYWDRHVLRGYGYTNLPSEPGSFDIDVPTWRPITSSSSHLDEMKSFFIGGGPELTDKSYISTPHDAAKIGSKLNKYGFRTESSGTLKIQLNCLHQIHQSPLQAARKAYELNAAGSPIGLMNSTHAGDNLRAISDALYRARVRLESLKSKRRSVVARSTNGSSSENGNSSSNSDGASHSGLPPLAPRD